MTFDAEKNEVPIKIVVLGDSLSTGFLNRAGYSQFLDDCLRDRGFNVSVKDESKLGATSAYGVYKAEQIVSGDGCPDVVVIALGGNDILHSNSPVQVQSNLEQVIKTFQDNCITVVLSGMQAPSWYSEEYKAAFNGIYTNLSEQYGVILDPLINERLIDNPDGASLSEIFNEDLMADEIHPNLKGARQIADDLADEVEQAIRGILETKGAETVNSTTSLIDNTSAFDLAP